MKKSFHKWKPIVVVLYLLHLGFYKTNLATCYLFPLEGYSCRTSCESSRAFFHFFFLFNLRVKEFGLFVWMVCFVTTEFFSHQKGMCLVSRRTISFTLPAFFELKVFRKSTFLIWLGNDGNLRGTSKFNSNRWNLFHKQKRIGSRTKF